MRAVARCPARSWAGFAGTVSGSRRVRSARQHAHKVFIGEFRRSLRVPCQGAGTVGVVLGAGPTEEPVQPFGHFQPVLPDEVAAALVQEGEVVGGGAVDVQVAAMQVTVAAGAEGDEVLRGGRALLAIVGEVVNVQVELVGAAGALAAVAVAPQDVDALFWSEVAGAGGCSSGACRSGGSGGSQGVPGGDVPRGTFGILGQDMGLALLGPLVLLGLVPGGLRAAVSRGWRERNSAARCLMSCIASIVFSTPAGCAGNGR